jgi:hypothetical protein
MLGDYSAAPGVLAGKRSNENLVQVSTTMVFSHSFWLMPSRHKLSSKENKRHADPPMRRSAGVSSGIEI